MNQSISHYEKLAITLGISVFIGMILYVFGVYRNQTSDFWYLSYNLALGLIPLLLALWLRHLLQKQAWKEVPLVIVTVLWVLFLPNSFYIISDFIHLSETPRVDIVQDVVMLAQFSFVGLVFGFMSLFIVHQELIKRMSVRVATLLVGTILLACSFAIYLGRDLRWNSWDIAAQPFALLTDIIEHLNFFAHPQMIITTLSFFMMLASIYGVLWQAAALFLSTPKSAK
jgi:uncharacterized membrane protein